MVGEKVGARRTTRAPIRSYYALSTLSRYMFVLPAIVYLFVFMLYPLGYNIYLSLFDVNVSTFVNGGADFVGLRNYKQYLASPDFLQTFSITIVFTLGSLLFQHTIGYALALFFNKGFPLSGLMRSLLMVVWVLPAVVSGSLWKWIYSGSYGLLNAFLGLIGIHSKTDWLNDPHTALLAVIAANIWVGIPFHMMLLYAGRQGIPGSLYEAASIDGTPAPKQFVHITLPLMRPVIFTALLLGFVHTFKTFDIVYVMTNGGPAGATKVLPIDVFQMTFNYFQLGSGAAAANVLLVIPLALSILYVWLRRKEDLL